MRVLEPTTVTVLTTNKCTAQCRHCSMNAGPDRNDTLSWPQLEKILTQLFAETKLTVVVFSGGESTMLGDDLLKALTLCKQHGVITRLVTNAFWATSPTAAHAKLKELRDAGLDELNISTDDYHLPYISLQKVRYAFDAARELNFMSLVLCNAYGPESWLTPERINKEFGEGSEMNRRFDANGARVDNERQVGKTLVMLSNGVSMKLGRGVQGLDESEVLQHNAEQLDEIGEQIGGCPWAVRSAAISAKGHLVSCCGFEVEDNQILDYGDLNDHSLGELLDRADNDLITNMIAIVGPVKLKQLLEQIAPDEVSFPRKSYRGYCEVCEDLVGIKKNRDALYKYQSLFVDAIVAARSALEQAFTVNGRVRIPSGKNLQLRARIPGVADSGQQPMLSVENLLLSSNEVLPPTPKTGEPPAGSAPAQPGKSLLPVLQPGSRCG
jgi:hypothetical protein